MPMPPLFFLHNQKAGGTSVRKLLEAHYPPEKIAPVFENGPQHFRDLGEQYSQFRGYSYYAGHYGYCVFEAVSDGHVLISNFRSPISRILSLYSYWRNDVTEEYLAGIRGPDATVVRIAKTKSFSDFIRDESPDLRIYLENGHYRQIYDTWYRNGAGGSLAIFKVLTRIVSMKWFLIAELPALSNLSLARAFPDLTFASIPTLNETSGKIPEQSLSLSDIEYLLRRNRRDLFIYAFAVGLLMWRLCRRSL